MRVESRLHTLLTLTKLGAHRRLVPMSTFDFGRILGLSQQAASLRLLELENEGMIERRRSRGKIGVRLTEAGFKLVSSLFSELKGTIERRKELLFRGRVFTGLREGGYYISRRGYRKQFVRLLGFDPFPGTLNLKLGSPNDVEQKRQLRSIPGIPIHGFEDSSRTYGGARCFRATINGVSEGAALVIDRTHYDDTVLELISPSNLRKELELKDGDEVSVAVNPDG